MGKIRRRAEESGLLRMSTWACIAILSSIALCFAYPHQIGVVLTKINLLSLSAWGGYWIDRGAFPYTRLHEEDAYYGLGMIRRALIISASMIAMALAL